MKKDDRKKDIIEKGHRNPTSDKGVEQLGQLSTVTTSEIRENITPSPKFIMYDRIKRTLVYVLSIIYIYLIAEYFYFISIGNKLLESSINFKY